MLSALLVWWFGSGLCYLILAFIGEECGWDLLWFDSSSLLVGHIVEFVVFLPASLTIILCFLIVRLFSIRIK